MSISKPTIAAGGTAKRAWKQFTFVEKSGAIPPAPYGYLDENDQVVFKQQPALREGQIIAVLSPGVNEYATLYVVADVGGGVLEWKVTA